MEVKCWLPYWSTSWSSRLSGCHVTFTQARKVDNCTLKFQMFSLEHVSWNIQCSVLVTASHSKVQNYWQASKLLKLMMFKALLLKLLSPCYIGFLPLINRIGCGTLEHKKASQKNLSKFVWSVINLTSTFYVGAELLATIVPTCHKR